MPTYDLKSFSKSILTTYSGRGGFLRIPTALGWKTLSSLTWSPQQGAEGLVHGRHLVSECMMFEGGWKLPQ